MKKLHNVNVILEAKIEWLLKNKAKEEKEERSSQYGSFIYKETKLTPFRHECQKVKYSLYPAKPFLGMHEKHHCKKIIPVPPMLKKSYD